MRNVIEPFATIGDKRYHWALKGGETHIAIGSLGIPPVVLCDVMERSEYIGTTASIVAEARPPFCTDCLRIADEMSMPWPQAMVFGCGRTNRARGCATAAPDTLAVSEPESDTVDPLPESPDLHMTTRRLMERPAAAPAPAPPPNTEEGSFRKLPVVVTAHQVTEREEIVTLEGTMTAEVGDWIITGIKGEKYPIKDAIFRETYVPVDAPAPPPATEEGELRGLQHLHGVEDRMVAAWRRLGDRMAGVLATVTEQMADAMDKEDAEKADPAQTTRPWYPFDASPFPAPDDAAETDAKPATMDDILAPVHQELDRQAQATRPSWAQGDWHYPPLPEVLKQLRQMTAVYVECAGMQAENMVREASGESMAYGENAFINLRIEHDLLP